MRAFGLFRLPRYALRKNIALIVLIALIFFYHVAPKLFSKVPPSTNNWQDSDFNFQRNFSSGEIVILRWTASWRSYSGPTILDAKQCSDLKSLKVQRVPDPKTLFNVPCRISYDRGYLTVSHALIFHSFDLMWEALPEYHDPHQLWIYQQKECPIYTKLNLQTYSNTFNWTMTYRRDSDIYFPYGYFVPVSNNSTNVTSTQTASLTKRKKLVAWIVSSCHSHSKREYFVEELRKYIPVSIFGWCGDNCPSLSGGNCYEHVARSHKFHLSFENSLCTDYITEKFFNALESDMVPVVYGGAQYDYAAIAPNNSYIDARLFNSPKELAAYLLYLDHNDNEYLKYSEWKKEWRLGHGPLGWCNLCQRLYEYREQRVPQERKWYRDMWKWWNYDKSEMDVDESDKWGSPVCQKPPRKLTESIDGSRSGPDLEPGILNGRIFGKLATLVKELVL